MFTLGYRFRPWTGTVALADGPSILDYVRDTAREYGVDRHIRYDHRVVSAEWDERGRPLDGHRRDRRRREAADLRVPVVLHRLLRLRAGAPARAARPRGLRRRRHPPAALARGLRPRRQADRGDRLGCHRGDAGARARRDRGARDDAAALPDVHPLGAERGRPGRAARPGAAAEGGVRRHPLEEHPGLERALQAQPPPARPGAPAYPQGDRGSGARHRRRHPLQPALRPVGPAALPGAGRRPVPGAAARYGGRGHRHHRDVHADRDPAGLRGRDRGGRRGDRDRAEAASRSAGSGWSSTATR